MKDDGRGPVHLVHLAEYAPPHDGGSFIPFLTKIADQATARGWAMTVVLPEAARERGWLANLEAAGARILFLSGERSRLVSEIKKLAGATPGPVILHTHFTTYDVAAVTVAWRSSRIKVYWHIHTVLSDNPKVVAANIVKFSLLGRPTERILCPSANIADGVARRLGPRGRIELFPSPIDTGRFTPFTEEERRRARANLAIPEGQSVLLMFARLWELKGADRLLASLRMLLESGEPVIALFNEGGDRARAEIGAAGVSEHARVVGPTPDVRELFAAADLFLAPSRGEGMPFAVVEALSCGLPVVASDIPGHRYLAERIEACRVVEGDPASLAAAIRAELGRAPEQKAALGGDAHQWISQNLDLQVATRRLFDMYDKTLESQR